MKPHSTNLTPVARRTALLVAIAALIAALPSIPALAAAPTNGKTANNGCIAVPKGFSNPSVKGPKAPASLWKGWSYGHVTLAASPASALIDQPVTIRVEGLKPGEPITLHVQTSDMRGRIWSSHATFIANDKGIVDVAKAAPEYGSYSGTHAMGLIWSMTPQGVKNPSATLFIPSGGDNYTLHLQAKAAGHLLAQTTFSRHHRAPGVKKTFVSTDGLVGVFYQPATQRPHPGVLVLGGSEGGLHPQVDQAALLASHGFAALGLAYFQGPSGRHNPRLAGLPKTLVNIPLEYFAKAAHWLQQQPGVEAQHIAVMGVSKGAEATLITAATFPKDFQAAVAVMPSSVVWFGLGGRGSAGSSWSLHGKPLPSVKPVMTKAAIAMFRSGKPISYRLIYAASLKKHAAQVKKAAIPVARIAGPVLLISGGDDQVWPSSMMARRIMQRLAAHHHSRHDESLCYTAAGHLVLPSYRPTNTSAMGFGGRALAVGGNPVAYAFADVHAWHKLLAFLHNALR